MQIKISICNEKQYNDDERPISFLADLPAPIINTLLETLETYIDDDPNILCRLHNDLAHFAVLFKTLRAQRFAPAGFRFKPVQIDLSLHRKAGK